MSGHSVVSKGSRNSSPLHNHATDSTATPTTSASRKKHPPANTKLEEINKQLAEVRQKLAEKHGQDHTHHARKKSPKQTQHGRKKPELHHPKLDFVLGEVVFSPYMTKPLDPYPQETFEVPKKLHDLRRKLNSSESMANVPKDELPYDVEYIKDRFLREVANFSVSFSIATVS